MAQIIAIVNQKGGVGKTTTAVNLTAALAATGARVLLCDFDPQANATSGLGVDKRKAPYASYDLILDGVSAEKAVIHPDYGDVIPSGAELAGATVELIGVDKREYQLKNALEPLRAAYDYIFILFFFNLIFWIKTSIIIKVTIGNSSGSSLIASISKTIKGSSKREVSKSSLRVFSNCPPL